MPLEASLWLQAGMLKQVQRGFYTDTAVLLLLLPIGSQVQRLGLFMIKGIPGDAFAIYQSSAVVAVLKHKKGGHGLHQAVDLAEGEEEKEEWEEEERGEVEEEELEGQKKGQMLHIVHVCLCICMYRCIHTVTINRLN